MFRIRFSSLQPLKSLFVLRGIPQSSDDGKLQEQRGRDEKVDGRAGRHQAGEELSVISAAAKGRTYSIMFFSTRSSVVHVFRLVLATFVSIIVVRMNFFKA